ncbi:MAG: hypothetical protein BRC54_02935 [Cyanobacteria bacterium SW_7_48_12]|nr:MAG: hypothetical protein BRC54_02935 [Cyanobacteria bacterium SW_7_48_12]
MFGFIKKIFSSIIAFFRGLLGGKKSEGEQSDAPKAKRKNGYFLELGQPNRKSKSQLKPRQRRLKRPNLRIIPSPPLLLPIPKMGRWNLSQSKLLHLII